MSWLALVLPSSAQVPVLQGFEVRWEKRPHRFKVLALRLHEGDPSAEVQAGSWADGEKAVDSASIGIGFADLPEREGSATGSIQLTLEGRGSGRQQHRVPAEIETTVEIPVAPGTSDAAVWLTGFDLRADPRHDDGFTLNTLEVTLGEPVVRDGIATLPIRAQLDGGPVPDRRQRLRTFGAEVRIEWVMLPVTPTEARRQRIDATQRSGGTLAKGKDRPASTTAPGERERSALVGLSGFRFSLDPGPLDGRYIRAIGLGVQSVEGTPDVSAVFQFDNDGPMARPVRYAFEADVTTLHLRPGESVVERWVTREAHPATARDAGRPH